MSTSTHTAGVAGMELELDTARVPARSLGSEPVTELVAKLGSEPVTELVAKLGSEPVTVLVTEGARKGAGLQTPQLVPDDTPPPQSTRGSGLPLEGGLGFRLGRLARALHRSWADELSTLGITPPQAAVLRGVGGVPGCSLRSLARALGTDPMNAKRCADGLEQRELVRSEHRSGDRRPWILTLTDTGRALAERVDILAREHERRLAAAIGPAERRRFEDALTRLEDV